jgi:hypothetical protein
MRKPKHYSKVYLKILILGDREGACQQWFIFLIKKSGNRSVHVGEIMMVFMTHEINNGKPLNRGMDNEKDEQQSYQDRDDPCTKTGDDGDGR